MPKQKKKYSSDIDDLTLGEIAQLRQLAPQLLPEGADSDAGINALRAMAFLQLKRDDPDATIDDADNVRWGDIDI